MDEPDEGTNVIRVTWTIMESKDDKSWKIIKSELGADLLMFRMVEFISEGVTLRGRLYAYPKPSPIVIMAHGFSATINGMVADNYAEVFHQAGFAVLLYDHFSLGISDG